MGMKVICPTCSGSGRTYWFSMRRDGWETCEKCKGKGKMSLKKFKKRFDISDEDGEDDDPD